MANYIIIAILILNVGFTMFAVIPPEKPKQDIHDVAAVAMGGILSRYNYNSPESMEQAAIMSYLQAKEMMIKRKQIESGEWDLTWYNPESN